MAAGPTFAGPDFVSERDTLVVELDRQAGMMANQGQVCSRGTSEAQALRTGRVVAVRRV